MKEFIIFVCTYFTEIFFSKLSSAALNYNLPSFFTDSYCAGVSNKHCLLTFFIRQEDDTREWVRDIWNKWFDKVFPPTPPDSEYTEILELLLYINFR